jgi:hypothetical protein
MAQGAQDNQGFGGHGKVLAPRNLNLMLGDRLDPLWRSVLETNNAMPPVRPPISLAYMSSIQHSLLKRPGPQLPKSLDIAILQMSAKTNADQVKGTIHGTLNIC